jgi:glycosyltransferase involved in cell wall biosynthesis
MSARVAVIIPCFNDGAYVEDAVRSVDEREPVEIAVVDDGSTDAATAAALARLSDDGVTVRKLPVNRGNAAARMLGLEVTSAPYVYSLDADDLAAPGALAIMANRLDADPRAAVCFGDYEEFGSRELTRAVPDRLDPYRLAFTNEYPVTALFRRTILGEVGGWQAKGYEGSFYSDWNLWMTLAESGAVGVHAGRGVITYRRRMHAGRVSAASRRRHRELYRRLGDLHAGLFANLAEHRRGSSLSAPRKLLYPVVYGGRPRLRVELLVKRGLDRIGIWTLRR